MPVVFIEAPPGIRQETKKRRSRLRLKKLLSRKPSLRHKSPALLWANEMKSGRLKSWSTPTK